MAARSLSSAIRITKNLFTNSPGQTVFRCIYDAAADAEQYREVCAALELVAQSRYHKDVQTLDTEHSAAEIGMVLSEAQHSAQAIESVGL